MGIFARLATLIKSNLNDLISRSEDPEKMLNQVVIDMGNQLIEAKKQVALSIADEKRLAKQVEQEAANAAEWERRAMLAIKAGDDQLAKEALARKKEHDGLVTAYKDQWNKQKQAVEQLKTALKLLNNKIEEAKRKKNVLLARKKRAEAQKAIQETMSGLNNASAFETFDRMAAKIDQMEAEAEAATELAEEATGDTGSRSRSRDGTRGRSHRRHARRTLRKTRSNRRRRRRLDGAQAKNGSCSRRTSQGSRRPRSATSACGGTSTGRVDSS